MVAVGLAMGIAGVAWAGPLDVGVVDEKASWMFHLDAEAAVASTCGKFLVEQMRNDPKQPLKMAVEKFGVEPTRDVKGLTVYGFKPGEDDGVAVIVASAAVDGLGEKLEGAGLEDFTATKSDGVTRYSWKDEHRSWYLGVRPAKTGDERFVVLASSDGALDGGLAVLAGTRPSVKALDNSEANAPMLAKPSEGSILFVAAKGLGDCEKFKTSLVKEARSLTIDMGERSAEGGAKETYAKAVITASDPQVALNMQQMVQGMIAFGSMMARDNQLPGAAEALQSVKVSADGASVKITSVQSSDVVLKRMKDLGAAIRSDGKNVSVSLETSGKGGADPKDARSDKGENPPATKEK
jgi:hypothetical protein